MLLRLIGKWLNAGVVEGLNLSRPDEGTPQGGVVSPLLANIYLHEVLDEWFVRDVRPALGGAAELVRYADDFAVLFERKQDAERFLAVLPERFGKYGLTLHPDKTRLVPSVQHLANVFFEEPDAWKSACPDLWGPGEPKSPGYPTQNVSVIHVRSLRSRWQAARGRSGRTPGSGARIFLAGNDE